MFFRQLCHKHLRFSFLKSNTKNDEERDRKEIHSKYAIITTTVNSMHITKRINSKYCEEEAVYSMIQMRFSYTII